MNTKDIFSAIVISVAFFSCEKSLVYIEEQFDPRVVSNSVLFADSVFKVQVSMSKSALDEEIDYVVPPADVLLFENGKQVVNLSHPKQALQSDFRLTEGNSYRMEVQAKNQKLIAETSVPKPVQIIGIDTTYVKNDHVSGNWYSSNIADKKIKIGVKINDPSGEKNYYRLVFYNRYYLPASYQQENTQYSLVSYPLPVVLDDPVFGEKNSTDNPFDVDHVPNHYAVFDDQLFDGKQRSIDISISLIGAYMYRPYSPYGKPAAYFEGKDSLLRYVDLTVCLQSLSKEAWLYYKSLNAYNSSYGDEFVEPVPVYTNINGGLGIFMGISQTSTMLNVDRKNMYQSK